MNRILFTTPILDYPASGGPTLRIENTIKALHQLGELHLVLRLPSFRLGGSKSIAFYRGLSHRLIFSPSVHNLSVFRPWRIMQRILRKLYTDDAKFIVDYAKKIKTKIIWFGFGNISYPLIKAVKLLDPTLTLICDTDSVWSRFIARELPLVNDIKIKNKIKQEADLKEQEEKNWVKICDITTAVSQVDADYYRSLTPNSNKIKLFSNVLDLANYQKDIQAPSSFKKPCIYLAGSFGHASSPMNRAALWLLNDILPLVKKVIPNIHCYLVGSQSKMAFGHLQNDNLTVTGRVDSVLPYLKNADVALTPLQFESGTRFKILEAAACSIPMVSTTLGAEGLPVQDRQHILIADTTQDFANAIIELIQNKALAKTIAQNSYELIKHHFGLNTLIQEAKEILDYICLSASQKEMAV